MEIVNLFFGPIIKILPKVPSAMLDLVIGYFLIQLVVYLVRRSIKVLRIARDLRGLIITTTKLILWVMLIIFISSQLGLGSLAALISGSAVVVVFFLNNSIGPLLSDIFAGLFLIGDPDFTVGMKVRANEDKTEGVIHGIDMRKVRIIDDKGKMHIVPNSKIENSEWVVLERKAK